MIGVVTTTTSSYEPPKALIPPSKHDTFTLLSIFALEPFVRPSKDLELDVQRSQNLVDVPKALLVMERLKCLVPHMDLMKNLPHLIFNSYLNHTKLPLLS